MFVPPPSEDDGPQTSAAVWQVLPPQQACPSPPQELQVPALPAVRLRPWQTKPDEQVPLLPVPQQAWPEPPQLLQTFPLADSEQLRLTPHVGSLGQQAWPGPPHDTQVLPASTPCPAQARPLWQLSPAQQAWPEPPQLSHVAGWPPPGALQPKPALQASLAQQVWPLPPQGLHMLAAPPPASDATAAQTSEEVWQIPPPPPPPPVQQACPSAPQAAHRLLAQRR
jgi:hypothetical protein